MSDEIVRGGPSAPDPGGSQITITINDSPWFGGEPGSLDITTTGCNYKISGVLASTWTFSGSGTFVGFSTASGATSPDSGYEVGDTVSVTTNLTLYSVSVSGIIGNPLIVGGGESVDIQASKSYTVSASGSTTISPDSGYDAMEEVALTVPAGSATGPSSITENSATISTLLGRKLILTKTGVDTTPTVSAGYISSATASTAQVQLAADANIRSAQTIYPSTSDQTISSSTYLTGDQTIKAVTTSNLSAANIKDGVTVEIGDSDDSDRVATVTGTFTDSSTVSSGQEAASSAEILTGYSAWVDGAEVQGNRLETPAINYTVNSSGATIILPYDDDEDQWYDAMEEVDLYVPAGTAGTPTATKGTVSSNSISVTPSVTNHTGWISGGTSTGTAVTVSASELVSGTKSITSNGTGIDVTNYASVDVNVSGGGGLPDGYTRVPYIEGAESQYFDTGIVPDANTKVECEFQYLSGYSEVLECVFGSQDYAFSRQSSSNALYFYTWGSNGKAFTSIRPDTEWHLVTKTATSTTLTDPTLANETKSTTAGSPTLTMALFADHLGSGYAQFIKGRIASCRIWDNTTLVRDYVPAVNSSNVAGMYDLVNNTFSTSASGTNFIAGNWDDMSAANLQASKSYTVSASGSQTISPDTGYDAMEAVSLSVPAQSLPTASASSATSGYTSKATITHSTADQYINIPTGFNNSGAYYKVDGTSLNQFVVRPDAELIQTWTDDYLVHADKNVTIPTYSTSATTLITGGAALSPTPTISSADYRWYLVLRHLTIPQYSVTTKAAGRQEYTAMSAMYEVVNILGGTATALVSNTSYSSRNVAVLAAGNAFVRCVYWSSGTAIKLYTANTYGCAMTINTAPAISSATADSPTITFYTPNVTIRGSTSYLSSTYYNAITDIRCQYVYQLYRVPKATGSWGMSGWGHYNNMVQIMNCAQSSTHKLT